MRKTILSFAIASLLITFLFCAGCTTTPVSPPNSPAEITPSPDVKYPDITGTWKSENEAGWNLNTTIQDVAVGENTWVFASQEGPVVKGFKLFRQPYGPDVNQTVLGIVDPDGKSLTIIDQPGGWAKGTLIDPDTMSIVLTYSSGKDTGGNSFALIMMLHRVKGTV
ncbi:hypothetical protein [Methanoregula sp.]|uniref:hypothetical protein n=1 Tax=Methanoregula sp. TaxID=2052170 RepID=UPI0026136428|nr:hypothetical protein [Methanoregula sp.]MDD5142054.1 hypothetical protein [Methanoregula sp.]